MTYALFICSGTVLLLGVTKLQYQENQRQLYHEHLNLTLHLSKIRAKLEMGINADSALIRGLASYISKNPMLSQQDFEDFAGQLMKNKSNIINMGAAPDLIIRYMHPLKGNEKAIGLDFNKNRLQKDAATFAKDAKQIIIAGPVKLVQGGEAFIGRYAIHIKNSDGEEVFWGLVSAPISTEILYRESGLQEFEQHNVIAIRGKDARGDKGDVFYGPSDIFTQGAIIQDVALPYGSWQIAAKPHKSWESETNWIPWVTSWFLQFIMLGIFHIRRQAYLDRLSYEKKLIDAKELAEHAARSKSDFLASMSHEIRTPMNGILGMTEVILNSEISEETREALLTIKQSGDALMTILNDILDISKINAGKLNIENLAFNFNSMISDLKRIFSPGVQSNKIAILTEVHPRFPEIIFGDPNRLRQVLTNLIGNAVKFTEHGWVKIIATPIDESNYEISVVDSGIGLSPEQISKLFVDFSQADQSTSRKYGGTGLGLSICKKLVELMDGTIGVESSPGKGSRFWFKLPLHKGNFPQNSLEQRSHGELKHDEHSENRDLELHKLKILLAEDNLVNVKVFCKLLEKMGATCEIAKNGQEAIDMYRLNDYDVIFMDVQMPIVDGLHATREIRQISKESRPITIYALTANVLQEDQQRCFDAGMDYFLRKPVKMIELKSALLSILAIKKGFT
jgi:signal transduction histidine kinase/CheY-like chemotaxis protein